MILNPPLHSHDTYVGKGYNIMLFIVLEKDDSKEEEIFSQLYRALGY